MPTLRSASPDFARMDAPGPEMGYAHGADTRRGYVPLAFQVTSPFDPSRVLLPHALVMHVNPSTFSETYTQKVERIQTRGGFVEQHWGADLTDLSFDGSTGAFVNLYTGLASVVRQRTIAWDRFRDLYDLYRHNGSIYDPFGNIVLQGKVMLLYDRGTFLGHFTNFDFEETDASPFAFRLSASFKVEHFLLKIPLTLSGPAARVPTFQATNGVLAGV